MDLRNNPFYILNLPCKATRATVHAATESAFFFDNARSESAQLAILKPDTRLEAEMDWFPDIPEHDVERIRSIVEQGGILTVPTDAGLLSQINGIIYNISFPKQTIQVLKEYTLRLDELFAKLSITEVTSIINSCRRESGFPHIRDADAAVQLNRKRAEIRSLLTESLRSIDDTSYVDLITQLADALKNPAYGGIIADAVDQYELRMFEQIKKSTSEAMLFTVLAIKSLGHAGLATLIDSLCDCLSQWGKLVRPIQIKSGISGMPHEASQDLGRQLMQLLNRLKADCETQDSALKLVNMMLIAFDAELSFSSELTSLAQELSGEEQLSDLELEQRQLEREFKDLQACADSLGSRRGQALHEDRRTFVSKINLLLEHVRSFKTATEDEKKEIYEGICSLAIETAGRLHSNDNESPMAYFLLCQLETAFQDFPDLCARLREEADTIISGSPIKGYSTVPSVEAAVTKQQLQEWYVAGNKFYKNGDYNNAAKLYRKAAEKGHADSQLNLGVCYRRGQGVEKSDSKATYWYRRAAEQDESKAQFYLGCAYENGSGLTRDIAQALHWFQRSAENGYADAQTKLGRLYEFGTGVEKNATTAVSWYRKAADQHDSDGLCCLGVCYENGVGVERDYSKATNLYQAAAEKGYGRAQCYLATCYEHGKGRPRDTTAAVAWYLKSAQSGDARGQTSLGVCFDNGIGLDTDPAAAVQWFRKAAEQGDARGQCYYALHLASGKGISQDFNEAVSWYRRSALQGNSQAQNNLGSCYENGTGVMKDIGEAIKWYRLAAEQGEKKARENLARLQDSNPNPVL